MPGSLISREYAGIGGERAARDSSARSRRRAAGRASRAAPRCRRDAPAAARSGSAGLRRRCAPRRFRRPRRACRRTQSNGMLGRLELHLPHALEDRRRDAPAAAASAIPASSTSALPVPDTPSLSLTITWPIDRAGLEHVVDRRGDVVEAVQVFGAERIGHPDLAEQPPAAGLGAERREPRIGAVHRDAEGHGDVALELGRVVRDQVAALAIRDAVRDAREQLGTLEQLRAERPDRGVADREAASAARAHGSG